MSSRAAGGRKRQLQTVGPPSSSSTNPRAAFQSKPNEVVRPTNNSSNSNSASFLKQLKPSYKPPAQALPTFDPSDSIWGPSKNPVPADLTVRPLAEDSRFTQPQDASRTAGNRPGYLGTVHEIDSDLLHPPSIRSATSSASSSSGGFYPSRSRQASHPTEPTSVHSLSPNRFNGSARPARSPTRMAQSHSQAPSPLPNAVPAPVVTPQTPPSSSPLGSLLSRSHTAAASTFQTLPPHVLHDRPLPFTSSAPPTQQQFPQNASHLQPPRSASSVSTTFPLPPSPSATSLTYPSFQSFPDELGHPQHLLPEHGLPYDPMGPIVPQRSLPSSFVPSQHPHDRRQQQILRSVSSTPSFNDIPVNVPPRPMYQQRRAESFDSVSILSGSSGPSRDNFPINPPPRMVMGFPPGPGQPHDPQAPPTFMYPGGRSRAHPNGAPRFRLRGRKKKDKKRQAGQESANGPTKKGVLTDSASERSWGPGDTGLPSPPLSAGDKDLPPQDAGVPKSESSSHFIFPGSRSVAHPDPKRLRIGAQSGHERQGSSASGNSWEEIKGPHTKFLGLASKSKQKKNAERSPSPMVRASQDSGGTSTGESVGASKYPTPDDTSSISGSISSSENPNGVSGRVFSMNNKVGQYPLDPYDSSLLELDLHTYGLLRKINQSPSFHDYGRSPPVSVLDLGCGQGHWLLDAAIAWKDHGTKCYGVDMVDTTKTLRPTAKKLGVAENIKFVKCNFLKQELPFADGSFDLVRMSCLTLSIPFEDWKTVLQEVWRVLSVGGRLELIDDRVIFPYAPPLKPSAATATLPQDDSVQPIKRELYELREEEQEDVSDTATLNGPPLTAGTSGGRQSSLDTSVYTGRVLSLDSFDDLSNLDPWHQHLAASLELESLFEHMLNHKFGIHLHPSEFVDGLLSAIFGHVKEVQNLNLVLAPPDRADGGVQAESGDDLLAQCPGVIATPSNFVPLTPGEVDAVVSKHSKILLSCKTALIEYALEVADANEVDEETIMEALWEYEGFIRQRFSPSTQIHAPENPTGHSSFDMRSMRESIMTSTTALSSEGLAALEDYQAELSPMFSIPSSGTRINPTEGLAPSADRRSRAPSYRTRSGSDEDLAVKGDELQAPPYSRLELCRVRSFNIYEAIKRPNPLH